MAQIADTSASVKAEHRGALPVTGRPMPVLWPRLALACIAVLAGVLNFWNLGANGLGNAYYAAAVRSMLQSGLAFRYACFDPSCFVTVDKPPLAFWVETASSHLFGFGSLGLLAPSALAGALSVLVLGHTASRLFGTAAGLVAALALALTPVAVATSRSNNPDAMLMLLIVLAAWAGANAVQSGQWRWVALTALLFGLGFLTKMLAAFLVLPAIVIAFLVCAPGATRARVAQILVAGAILAIVCFGWMLSVDLTPEGDRPTVGSSGSNSELSLAFGSNGIQRIFGLGAIRGGSADGYLYVSSGGTAVAITPGGAAPGGVGTVAGAAFGGPAGPGRLLTDILAAQASWLLPLAVIGFISALLATRRRERPRWLAGLLIFGGWTGVTWAVFSFAAGIFHPYYVSELAPGVAGLVGVGVVALSQDILAGRARALLPAAAIAGTGLYETSILASTSSLGEWRLVLVAIGLVTAAVLTAPLLVGGAGRAGWWSAAGRGAFALGVGALSVAPAIWALAVPATIADGMIPMARGPGATPTGDSSGFTEGVDADRLLGFLEANAGQQRYLLATDSPPIGGVVDTLIARSGKSIIPLGGFGGPGSSVTGQQLAAWVSDGQLRYFLLGDGPGRRTPLTSDVQSVCPRVPTGDWGGSGEPTPGGRPDSLYDCAGKGGELGATVTTNGN